MAINPLTDKFRIFLSSKQRPDDIPDQWYNEGKFLTLLPTTFLLPPAKYLVSVNSFSLDFAPINIEADDLIYFRQGQQRWRPFHCPSAHYDTPNSLVIALNEAAPQEVRFELTVNPEKVKITIEEEFRVWFSMKIATLLGFLPHTDYESGEHVAFRLPDMYYYFNPMYLCSNTLTHPCPTPGESWLPILRPIPIEGKLTEEGRRVTMIFENKKRWVKMMTHQLHDIDFFCVCSDFVTVPKFLPGSDGCVIELEIKREKLTFL